VLPLQVLLTALVRWIAGEQQEVIEYLRAENLVLKVQLRGRRGRLSDAERRRLALLGARLGRPILTQVATIVRPDNHAVCVIKLCSQRVQSMASPLHPHEQVVSQVVPPLADVVRPELVGPRVRICDRDRAWSTAVQHRLHAPDVPRIRAPVVAPNCDAHAPRFVPSSQEECVKRVVSLGEGYDRLTLAAFVTPHHRERNDQGLGNELLDHLRGQHSHVPPCYQRAA